MLLVVTTALLAAAFAWTRWHRVQPQPLPLAKDSTGYTAAISRSGDVIAVSFTRGSWGSAVPPSPGGWSNAYAAELRDGFGGRLLRALQAPSPNVSWLTRPAFSPDGLSVAMVYLDSETYDVEGTACVAGKHIELWQVASGRIIWKTRYADADENLGANSLLWTPDGNYLLADGDHLRLFDARTGRRLRTLAKAYYQETDCRLAPDGTRLVTAGEGTRQPRGSYRAPGSAIVRDLAGRVLARLPGRGTSEAFWSRDGKTLVQHVGSTVRGWDQAGRRVQWTLSAAHDYSLVLSRDGKALAWASSQPRAGCRNNPEECVDASTVEVWSVAERRVLWTQEVAGYLKAVRFSPDGRSLAGAVEGPAAKATYPPGPSNDVLLWDAATGTVRRRATPRGQFPAILFFPDGNRALLETTMSLSFWPLK
jgi:WD40 repeat protein